MTPAAQRPGSTRRRPSAAQTLGRRSRAALVSAGALLACSTAPPTATTAPSAGPARLGTPVTADGLRLVALDVEECATDPVLAPPPEHRKLSVLVEVTATGSAPLVWNPFHATLRDEQGLEHHLAFGGCAPELGAARLAPGATARGWVAYDVPSRPARYDLVYAPPEASDTGRAVVTLD